MRRPLPGEMVNCMLADPLSQSGVDVVETKDRAIEGQNLVTAVRVAARVLKALAYGVFGVAVCIVLLRSIVSDASELPRWTTILLLIAVSVGGFFAGLGLSVFGDGLAETYAARSVARQPGMSADELEEERLRETPRLARESGPALEELLRRDEEDAGR